MCSTFSTQILCLAQPDLSIHKVSKMRVRELLGAWYLVPHVMLLERIAIFEDLQAIRAEQMPSVLMDHPKMDIYLRVE